MARIIYTGLVESIRGSIKGTTFQKNAYGYTVKAKPNMVNPNTGKQQTRKQQFADAISAWKDLSDTERANWNTYANTYPIQTRNNPDAYLNGFNAFGRHNAVGRLLGQPPLADPDGPQGSISPYQEEIILDSGTLYVLTDNLPSEGPWVQALFLTRPLSAGQKFVKSWTRYIRGFTLTGSIELSLNAFYIPIFGSLPALGDKLGTRSIFWNTTNGQVFFTPPSITEVIA